MAEADMVEGPVEGVTYEEVMKAINKMKLGKAAGPSKVNVDMTIASGKFVVVIKKLCQRYGMVKMCQRHGNECYCPNL